MTEDFKRPDHPDFMTSSELAKIHFSGIRHNSINDYMEFWIEGERRFDMSVMDFKFSPEKWEQEMANCLGLYKVEITKEKGN